MEDWFSEPAATLQRPSCRRHALLLRGLEKMDSASGGHAVHTAAPSRAALLYLGAAEVGGKMTQLIQFSGFSFFLSIPAASLP